MAAAVSSVWAKPGAWALEAEEHEAELEQQKQIAESNQTSDSSDFPSLAAAATTKTKKKKAQKLSLADFVSGKAAPAPQTERLTQAELVSLPTGPRERSAEELDRSKLGGGFRSYGSGLYGEDSSNSRWGSSRVSEDGEKRGGFRDRDDSGPSRADENDNWAATKKTIGGGGNGFDRRESRGGGGGGFFESQSKADEVDSWISSKPSRFNGGSSGGGNGDRFEKRGSFESLSRNRDSQFGSSGGADSDTWGRRREESNSLGGGGGETGGVSRPRLVLQPRSLPVPVVEVKPERPVTPVSVVEKPVIVERPKGANPFGNARPREEVLAEKGQDWKEIEEKLEAVKLKEVAAAIEKKGDNERSPGKIGFGFGNGREDRTERSWRKSTEQSEEGGAQQEEEGAQQEEEACVEEEANKEETKEEEEKKN